MKFSLLKPIQVLLFFFLLFAALIYAKPFLVPFTIAALLAMLFQPVSSWLEERGWPRALAIIACILIILGLLAGVGALLAWQIADLAKDFDKIEQNLTQQFTRFRQYVEETFGISRQQQKEIINQGQQGGGKVSSLISTFLSGIGGFLTDTLLMFVYFFLFLYTREHLRRFVLRLVPEDERAKTAHTMEDTRKVAQKYLAGLGGMIVCLWVLYGIGFSIVGIKSALFFAILCGILEIVPFVGNLTGSLITVITVFAQGGGTHLIIGVLVTYALVQFVQTYILEPLVVGAEVSINPLTTIAGLVVGELVWGIPGMILAIPLLGIIKIICDNVEPWKPVGYLLGETKREKKPGLFSKIRQFFKSRFTRHKHEQQ